MGLTSNTGLVAAVNPKNNLDRQKSQVELRCEVTPAPFMLRPYAGLYNPFSHSCSVLCNHPAENGVKEYVKRAKDAWCVEGKAHYFHDDLSKFQDQNGQEKEKNRTPHDIVTEDMFRRYTETDSRPLTPAPTLASGKSRGSRRCLTPDQPHQKTAIVVDLRRSHSQETLYFHGYTSDITGVQTTSATNERSTLPSLNLSEAAHNRLVKGQCEQLPPLASPLVLAKRAVLPKEGKGGRKSQLKALNLGKSSKSKLKGDSPTIQSSKADKEGNDGEETGVGNMDEGGGGEGRRRGKRRKKGRAVGSDRLTSAGLAAQTQQDPETQIAGIGTDSQNPSSRGSLAPAIDDIIVLPVIKSGVSKKTDSFLDDDILKYLHREVDEEAIETEFDTKRRYVLEEALRTRESRPACPALTALVRELRVPPVSLAAWLHVPRVYSRTSAHFALPIDTRALETLTPMKYAARFITLKKSKQLLYMTVLRKFKPKGYRMPIKDIREGLILMMGGILTEEQADNFSTIMDWDTYEEEENFPDDIKLTFLDNEYKKHRVTETGDGGEPEENTIKYRTWCGVCAICERMYGRFPPRERDPPNGIEVSDFSMVETKLPMLKINKGLIEILNVIRWR